VLDTNLWLVIKFAIVNPCFADPSFLTEMMAGAREICTELGKSEAMYIAASNNLEYYEEVELSYHYYYWTYSSENFADPYRVKPRIRYKNEEALLFNDPTNMLKEVGVYWDDFNATKCDVDTFLEDVGPTDSTVNISSVAFFVSAIAALFLQPILANLVWSIFVLIDPLAIYWGRVEMPYLLPDRPEDGDAFDDVKPDNKTNDEDLGDFGSDILNELEDDARKERAESMKYSQKAHLEALREYVVEWERVKGFCPMVTWIIIFCIIVVLQA